MAKIAGIEMRWAFNRAMRHPILAVCLLTCMTQASCDLANSHIIPALIRKMHEAKLAGATSATP